jgi:hypothetical protein
VLTVVKNSMEPKELDSAQQNVELQFIERRCVKCKEIKNRSEFHKSKSLSGGIHYTCKPCRNESRRKTNRSFIADNIPDGKIYCQICKKTKDANESNFYKSKIKDSSKVLICIQCRRSKNRENAKLKSRQQKERHERWRIKNAGHVRSESKKRKIKIKQATPPWFESKDVEIVYKKAVEFGFDVDHIVPINSDIVCGLHCHDNLQLLHKSVNCSKKNRYWPDMP